jgi:hypothetical protein
VTVTKDTSDDGLGQADASDQQVVVHRFTKSQSQEVRCSLGAYRGKETIDLRIFFGDAPTKRGISLPIWLFGELEEGVRRLGLALKARGQ